MPLFDESELAALAAERNAKQAAEQTRIAAEQRESQSVVEFEREQLERAIAYYTQAARAYLAAAKKLGIGSDLERTVVVKEEFVTKKLFGSKKETITREKKIQFWKIPPGGSAGMYVSDEQKIVRPRNTRDRISGFYEVMLSDVTKEKIKFCHNGNTIIDTYEEAKSLINQFAPYDLHVHLLLFACNFQHNSTETGEDMDDRPYVRNNYIFTSPRPDAEMKQLIDETFREHLREKMGQK